MSGWPSSRTILLNAADNVAVALSDLAPGETIELDGGALSVRDEIPAGHKAAVADIGAGEAVYKYGQIIGFASKEIKAGQHVHTHNLAMGRFGRDYAVGVDARPTEYVAEESRAVFEGYLRPDGRVGIRNYVGVLASVNCSASVCHFIAEAFKGSVMDEWPNVDGVLALGHGLGCGMAVGGEGHLVLQRALAGFARHPNFAGVLVIGLGCEANQVEALVADQGLEIDFKTRVMTIQDLGGTRATVERGIDAVKELLAEADKARRQRVSAGELIVGLECGGSDAYSGITANPALGAAADLVVAHGGTVILSETPEIYGAEHLLTRRAVSREAADKLIERIRWWEDYTARLGGEINNNPTPGNKAGGLTTILEKSLGAAAKGGSTNLVAVYDYAEPVTAKGLVFMDTPGYDMVSITGMIAGGAHLICFTTGRGTVCGSKPAPSLKLASNSAMYERLTDDMDFNCGAVIDGGITVGEMGREIFDLILAAASGRKTKSEAQGFGDHEFVPWQLGAVM